MPQLAGVMEGDSFPIFSHSNCHHNLLSKQAYGGKRSTVGLGVNVVINSLHHIFVLCYYNAWYFGQT